MRHILKSSAAASLLVNGYALVANAGLSSALGIVFWVLATRLYTQEQVGFAAALIASMTTISYLSQMNLSSFLTRFIPQTRARAGRLILFSYIAACSVAAIVALAFALGIGDFAEPLQVIRGSFPAMGIFVAATVVWTVFALQDAALSGLRRSTLVPVENAVYSVLKILFLVLFAMLALPAPGGIFLAWVLPLLPVVAVVNLIIFRQQTDPTPDSHSASLDLQTSTRFLGWDFFGSLALATSLGVAPLMITASAGVAATATYHLAWSFAYSIYLIGRSMSVSLVAEGASEPWRLRRLISDSLCHTLLLVTGAVVIVFAAAAPIMGIFGRAYISEGEPILRALVLSCIPWAVTTIYCAVARVRGQTHLVAAVQAMTLAILVSVGAVLLPLYGAFGVALGWLAAHLLVCAGVVAVVILRSGPGVVLDWALALASSAAQIGKVLVTSLEPNQMEQDSVVEGLLDHIDYSWIADLTPERISGSLGDVEAVLLTSVDPEPGIPIAVLKYTSNERGALALRRNTEVLNTLAADSRLDPYREIIPRIIHFGAADGRHYAIETAVTGTEGRELLHDEGRAKVAMTAAASVVSEMHRRTSKLRILDDVWAEEWINQPAEIAMASSSLFLKQEDRKAAFESLRGELRRVLVGREDYLGLGHGDLWPGNLFFTVSDSRDGKVDVTGLIDWDASRPDALAAIDTCHLGLSLRMARSGQELGPVVRDLLRSGGWSAEGAELLHGNASEDRHIASDRRMDRAILMLTWLNHIANGLGKSDRVSTNPLWVAVNVDSVVSTIARTSETGT